MYMVLSEKKTARLFGMRIINWEGCKCELMKTEFDVHIQREYMLTPTEEGVTTTTFLHYAQTLFN